MPIYEYTCLECGTQFEKFVRSMATVAEVNCPECGSSRVKKGWSLFGVAGSGGTSRDLVTSAAGACGSGGT